MTATLEDTKCDMQQAHDIAEVKAYIKNLVREQTAQKAMLRKSHDDIPEMTVSHNPKYPFKVKGVAAAGWLMPMCRMRAARITVLHMDLNEMLGKPCSHAKKQG